MKKEYVSPSLKVMKINMGAMVMTSAKTDVDWQNGESDNDSGVLFNDYDDSNTTGPDWDF